MDRNPWDRMDEESATAFEAFVVYRDLGAGRSLSKAGEKLGKTAGTLSRWSADFSWTSRALEWDRHLDRIIQASTEKTISEARSDVVKHHIKIAELMIGVGANQINHMAQQIEEWQKAGSKVEEYPLTLTPRDAASLIEKGIMLRRLSEGESTSNSNVNINQPRRYVVVPPSARGTEEPEEPEGNDDFEDNDNIVVPSEEPDE